MIYITGDTHGNFYGIQEWCREEKTNKNDILIILGDAGINFYGPVKDCAKKKLLQTLPITLFCIHGNHEMRPESIPEYKLKSWKGGKAYIEEDFPSLIFAKDGEVYYLNGQKTLVLGGAYSVDKHYRLLNDLPWFSDEQPSNKIKKYVEEQLIKQNYSFDVVLSHTIPLKYEPVDTFLPGIDQSKVDKSTEIWLNEIEAKLSYDKWYCGHYHIERKVGKIQFLYSEILPFE